MKTYSKTLIAFKAQKDFEAKGRAFTIGMCGMIILVGLSILI